MRAKIVMNEQVCRTCKELKPIGEYYLRSANSAGEKKPNLDCKLCTLAAIKAKKAQNV